MQLDNNQNNQNNNRIGYMPVSFSSQNSNWNLSMGLFKIFDGYLFFHWSTLILILLYGYLAYISGR